MTVCGSPFRKMFRPSDDGIGAEAALPERVTQQHHAIVAGLVLVREEMSGPTRPSSRRSRSSVATRARRGSRPARRRQSAWHANQPPPPGIRTRCFAWPSRGSSGSRCRRLPSRKPFEHADDAVRLGIWQGAQEDALRDTEHGGIGADREGDRGDGDGREARAVAEAPNGVADVVKHADVTPRESDSARERMARKSQSLTQAREGSTSRSSEGLARQRDQVRELSTRGKPRRYDAVSA